MKRVTPDRPQLDAEYIRVNRLRETASKLRKVGVPARGAALFKPYPGAGPTDNLNLHLKLAMSYVDQHEALGFTRQARRIRKASEWLTECRNRGWTDAAIVEALALGYAIAHLEAEVRFGSAIADAATMHRALKRINSEPVTVRSRTGTVYTRAPITDSERARYLAADKALRTKYPVAAERYQAIADQENARGRVVKNSRVDYAINGPRGRRRKK